ncbi:MAG: hypothetical protein RL514_234 [Verrucomicrobiota bacterium]|jgi:hypothetical protein
MKHLATLVKDDAFSLTLTLSRWEREQPRARVEVSSASAPIQRGLRFSLSQRERAGVRENAWEGRPLTNLHLRTLSHSPCTP